MKIVKTLWTCNGTKIRVSIPAMAKKQSDAKKTVRSLFNMEVGDDFRDAVRELRHLDPNVPTAKEVVHRAVFELLKRQRSSQGARG